MKILLIGGRGQLGRCLLQSLGAHELIAPDHSSVDVTDLDQVCAAVRSCGPDLVINASAFNDVDSAELNQRKAYLVNAGGPRNLALATASHGIPLLHVSTDYVFDGRRQSPYHEFCTANPLSTYGCSKLAGELAVRELNCRHYIVRTAWLFWECGRNFLLSMHRAASQPEVLVESDSIGSPTYVPHLARAIGLLITSKAYGTYHLVGRGAASRWELVLELYRILDMSCTVTPVPRSHFAMRAARPAYSVLETLQQPRIELPPWQEGVATFAREIQGRN